MPRRDASPTGDEARKHPRSPSGARWAAFGVVLLLLLATAPRLLANGGTVRISRAPVGPYLVTVYSSPTPLRTGEVDVSVLVQDSANRVLDVPVRVEARPLRLGEGAEAQPIRQRATRAQATNKLFKAAKFDVAAPGEWAFRVEVAEAGSVGFEATVARTTLLDRPWLLTVLVLLPLAVVGWLLLGREEEE